MIRSLKEAYDKGIEKSRLEWMSKQAPHLAGSGPNFEEWANQVLSEYCVYAEKAKNIVPPKGFLNNLAFRLGYSEY